MSVASPVACQPILARPTPVFSQPLDYATVKERLQKGKSSGLSRANERAFLIQAIYPAKDREMVQLFIKANVDLNGVNSAPLGMAIRTNQYSILKLLLDNGANPNLPDLNGKSLLAIATQDPTDSDPIVVAQLLLAGAKPDFQLLSQRDIRCDKMKEAETEAEVTLLKSIKTGDLALFLESMNGMTEVNVTKNGVTVLHHAIYLGRAKMALILLRYGGCIIPQEKKSSLDKYLEALKYAVNCIRLAKEKHEDRYLMQVKAILERVYVFLDIEEFKEDPLITPVLFNDVDGVEELIKNNYPFELWAQKSGAVFSDAMQALVDAEDKKSKVAARRICAVINQEIKRWPDNMRTRLLGRPPIVKSKHYSKRVQVIVDVKEHCDQDKQHQEKAIKAAAESSFSPKGTAPHG